MENKKIVVALGRNAFGNTFPKQQERVKKAAKAIADLVKNKRIDGITALRDESDREGMRVVIELRHDVNPSIMLNKLFKHTELQSSFGIIMLALVKNEPKVLSLDKMLHYYLEHQEEVVTRRTQYDLG